MTKVTAINSSNVWASRMTPSLDALKRVQSTLSVGLIMVPRERFLTVSLNETAAEVSRKNTLQFSSMPVVNGAKQIVGLYDASRWFGGTSSTKLVGSDYEALSEPLLIGADASILDFVVRADDRPTRLVVAGHEVAGLVSFSDLQQLPVRAALFTFVTSLEVAMAYWILKNWEDSPNGWTKYLNTKAQTKVATYVAKAKKNDSFVDEVFHTELFDKIEILCKEPLFGSEKHNAKLLLHKIRELRNGIAHANFFAETPERAKEVCACVREGLKLKKRILDDLGFSEKVHNVF